MKLLINALLMLVLAGTMVGFVIPPLISADTISAIFGVILLLLTIIVEAYWSKKVFGKVTKETK